MWDRHDHQDLSPSRLPLCLIHQSLLAEGLSGPIDQRWLHCVMLKGNEGCRGVRVSLLFWSSSSGSDDELTNTCYKVL